MFNPSTTTLFFLGNARITLPFLPLSFPAMMTTLSPFFIFIRLRLNDFLRQGNYLLITFLCQFPRYRAENAAGLRIQFAFFEYNHRVVVKAYIRTVFAPVRLARAHDHRLMHILFLDQFSGAGYFYRNYNLFS